MKTLIALLLIPIFPLLTQAASFTGPKAIEGTSHLFRGAQPLGKAAVIRAANIEQVVIFKNDVKGEVVREAAELLNEGVAHVHIPMAWKEIDTRVACEQTIEALQIMIVAEREGVNTYVHCTAGEDRTGMVAGLARMLLTGDSKEEMFEDELCAHRYADGNPHKPVKVVKEIEKGLTPLFFALASKIEAGDLSEGTLSRNVCANLVVSPAKVPTCY